MENPLTWRNCPKCGVNLVDAEISEPLRKTCETGAFYSKLLGERDMKTWKVKYWKCPDCKEMFIANYCGETNDA